MRDSLFVYGMGIPGGLASFFPFFKIEQITLGLPECYDFDKCRAVLIFLGSPFRGTNSYEPLYEPAFTHQLLNMISLLKKAKIANSEIIIYDSSNILTPHSGMLNELCDHVLSYRDGAWEKQGVKLLSYIGSTVLDLINDERDGC